MIINPHISKAIETYKKAGTNFHEILTWHLLHGIVLATPDFLCVGYYCRKDDFTTPLNSDANTWFVSFATGKIADLKAGVHAAGMTYIAFARGFKSTGPAKVYPIDRFLSFIN